MFSWPRWPWGERAVCGSPEPLAPPPHPEAANIKAAREMIAMGVPEPHAAAWLVRQCPGAFTDAAAALREILDLS